MVGAHSHALELASSPHSLLYGSITLITTVINPPSVWPSTFFICGIVLLTAVIACLLAFSAARALYTQLLAWVDARIVLKAQHSLGHELGGLREELGVRHQAVQERFNQQSNRITEYSGVYATAYTDINRRVTTVQRVSATQNDLTAKLAQDVNAAKSEITALSEELRKIRGFEVANQDRVDKLEDLVRALRSDLRKATDDNTKCQTALKEQSASHDLELGVIRTAARKQDLLITEAVASNAALKGNLGTLSAAVQTLQGKVNLGGAANTTVVPTLDNTGSDPTEVLRQKCFQTRQAQFSELGYDFMRLDANELELLAQELGLIITDYRGRKPIKADRVYYIERYYAQYTHRAPNHSLLQPGANLHKQSNATLRQLLAQHGVRYLESGKPTGDAVKKDLEELFVATFHE